MSHTPYDIPPQENKGSGLGVICLAEKSNLENYIALDQMIWIYLWQRLQKSEATLISRKRILENLGLQDIFWSWQG